MWRRVQPRREAGTVHARAEVAKAHDHGCWSDYAECVRLAEQDVAEETAEMQGDIAWFEVVKEEQEKRIVEMEEQLETERMRVVACGVAAGCNTEESIARHGIKQGNPYWTPAYGDVCGAVKREMEYREKNKALEDQGERAMTMVTEQRYRFWVQGPLPGQNEIVKAAKGFGGRGYGYSRLKKAWTQSIAWLVKAARIPPLKRVRLEFEWVHANRRRDKDNVEGGGAKLAWDSLVVAGVLKNDGWKQNAGSTHTHTLGPKPGVWITVIPVAASNSRLGSSSTPPR